MTPQTLTRNSKNDLARYSVLRQKVQEIFIGGQKRIEKEFIRLRWETGEVINTHFRLNLDQAQQGKNVLLQLESDTGIDHSELGRFAQFAKAYPSAASWRQVRFSLTWSHYKKLITVHDDKRRFDLTVRAEKNEWTLDFLADRIRHEVQKNKGGKEPERLPLVCVGPFYTYKIIRPETIHSRSKELLLDFGFGFRVEMSRFKEKFPAETIVTSIDEEKLVKAEGADEGVLYTYKAYVEKILDGDTLKLEFAPGFGQRKSETIRLNHIDCPELNTPEGQAAKRFVESQLSACDFLTVKSVKTRKEKWGRYLGDIFFARRGKLVYLNQLLLDKGHAVRVRR